MSRFIHCYAKRHYAECRYDECLGAGAELKTEQGAQELIGGEPNSCSGRVFHFKLASFTVEKEVHAAYEPP
jgi:hypothetical protein